MSMAFAPGLPNVMAPVNMPSYGPNVGYSAVDPGYNSGAGLAPLSDPYAGQGQGIYNDASMYRGGDFWGGGSDPYAGTIYAGGAGSNATPYDQYGSSWDIGGGSGMVTADAPARGSAEWYGAGWDMMPDSYWHTDLGLPIGVNDWQQPAAQPPSYSSGIAPDMSGGQGYGGYQPPQQSYSSGIPPDTSGGQGFNFSGAPPRGSAEWYGQGWDMIPDTMGGQGFGGYQPPAYSSGIPPDTSGGQGFSGGGGGQSPAFDYNAMNSPSFDGNWGDAAFMARPGGVAPGLYGSGDYSSARDFRGMSDADWYGGGYDMIPGASRDNLARMLGQQATVLDTSGGESFHPETQRPPSTKMQVGPEDYPPTPFGGGFNNRPPTYNNQNEFNQPGTGTIAPPGSQPWMFPGYTPQGSGIPGMDPNWNGDPGTSGMQQGWGGRMPTRQEMMEANI